MHNEGQINWHYIPPRSPHFGGLWEASAESATYHLKRIVGKVNLTFENLYTVLVQIEAIMSSRPISPISSGPNDPSLSFLSPAHFLVFDTINAIPAGDLEYANPNRLAHYQKLQQLV